MKSIQVFLEHTLNAVRNQFYTDNIHATHKKFNLSKELV